MSLLNFATIINQFQSPPYLPTSMKVSVPSIHHTSLPSTPLQHSLVQPNMRYIEWMCKWGPLSSLVGSAEQAKLCCISMDFLPASSLSDASLKILYSCLPIKNNQEVP